MFRNLSVKLQNITVNDADLTIDASGKTIINIDFSLNFSQNLGNIETTDQVQYVKTHKQIKSLSQELGIDSQKIKYMEKQK